jgi:hypothetical protein
MSQTKRFALIFLTLAALLVILLAMSLPSIQLSRGQPFSLGEPPPDASAMNASLPGGEWILLIFRGIIAICLVLFPFYIIYSLLTPGGRKRLLALAILLAVMLLVADYVGRLQQKANLTSVQPGAFPTQVPEKSYNSNPVATFSAAPPQWLTLAAIGIIAVCAAAFIFWLTWFIRQRRRPRQPAWDELAQHAQTAMDALQSGGDFNQAILRCYQEMMRVVQQEKGLAREKDMTPREFEDRLIQQGLPGEPVRRLTRLFERVRYGGLAVSRDEESLALLCLADIASACQAMEGQHDLP